MALLFCKIVDYYYFKLCSLSLSISTVYSIGSTTSNYKLHFWRILLQFYSDDLPDSFYHHNNVWGSMEWRVILTLSFIKYGWPPRIWGQIEIKPQEYIDIYSQIYIFLERDKKIGSYKLPKDWGVKQIRKQTHVKDWTLILI